MTVGIKSFKMLSTGLCNTSLKNVFLFNRQLNSLHNNVSFFRLILNFYKVSLNSLQSTARITCDPRYCLGGGVTLETANINHR